MSTRTTAAAAVAVLALALSACSSNGSDDKPGPSPSSSAPASPTVDPAAARKACVDAWAEGLQDGTAGDDSPPAECGSLPAGDLLDAYADAVVEHNKANRGRISSCAADPACTEVPLP